jgi:hypothetical protein
MRTRGGLLDWCGVLRVLIDVSPGGGGDLGWWGLRVMGLRSTPRGEMARSRLCG